MPIQLNIDESGGADFKGHHLRNVASLHIGGASPGSETLEVTGNASIFAILLGVVSKTTSYTALLTDSTILCDAS